MKCNKYVFFMVLVLLSQWIGNAYAQQRLSFCEPLCSESWLHFVLQPKKIVWGPWFIDEQSRLVPLSMQIQMSEAKVVHYYFHWYTTASNELRFLGVEMHLNIQPWGSDWNKNVISRTTKYGDKTTK